MPRSKTQPAYLPNDPLTIGGIDFYVDWSKWTIGASVFIPAYNIEKAKKDITVALSKKVFDWIMREEFENGVQGIRIWRVN